MGNQIHVCIMNNIIPINSQIANLARDILDADDFAKPSLLLKLKEITSSQSQDQEITLIEIWRCRLPNAVIQALRLDFTKVSGMWLTACQLINTAVECCFFNPRYLQEIKKEYIPALIQESLNICRSIVKEYQTSSDMFKINLCANLSWIITSITTLMKSFVFVSVLVVASKHFLQFLMSEDDRISLLSLSLLKNIIETNSDVFYHAAESRMHNVADELAYKISSTKDKKVARMTVSILLNLLRLYSSLLDLFVTKRYRGFKMYLNKWKGNGFDENIEYIMGMLEEKAEKMKSSQRHHNAAIVIQSFYRGCKTRNKLKTATLAMSKFQQSYRKKIETKQTLDEKKRLDKVKKDHDERQRRKGFVKSKTKQLQSIEGIPAKTVDTFLDNLQQESARKIQASWSGWKTRKVMREIAPHLVKEKAAILLQRQIRRWLEKVRKVKQDARLDMIPDGLNDERRIELSNVLVNIREKFPKVDVSDEELIQGHLKANQMLNNHVIGLRSMRRRDDHRRALIGQLTIQSETLSRMPNLSSANEMTLEQLASRSTPVMVAARKQHVEFINDLKRPWWDRLSDESAVEDPNRPTVLGSHVIDYEKNF
ncbi:IQ calmodulin-binding motif-containing protein 1-like [Clytia hemisphaerica]